jgi:hypothetical protein
MLGGERFRFSIEWRRDSGLKIYRYRQSGSRPCKKRKDGAPTVWLCQRDQITRSPAERPILIAGPYHECPRLFHFATSATPPAISRHLPTPLIHADNGSGINRLVHDHLLIAHALSLCWKGANNGLVLKEASHVAQRFGNASGAISHVVAEFSPHTSSNPESAK